MITSITGPFAAVSQMLFVIAVLMIVTSHILNADTLDLSSIKSEFGGTDGLSALFAP